MIKLNLDPALYFNTQTDFDAFCTLVEQLQFDVIIKNELTFPCVTKCTVNTFVSMVLIS